jgi:hypothetical protein
MTDPIATRDIWKIFRTAYMSTVTNPDHPGRLHLGDGRVRLTLWNAERYLRTGQLSLKPSQRGYAFHHDPETEGRNYLAEAIAIARGLAPHNLQPERRHLLALYNQIEDDEMNADAAAQYYQDAAADWETRRGLEDE